MAVGAVLAIVSAAVLGLGVITYLPTQQQSSSTITFTSTLQSSTATMTSLATSTTTTSATSSSTLSSSSVLTSTTTAATTISSSSLITETPIIYSGKTVSIDPALQVPIFRSVLSSGNATEIAGRLAAALEELPVVETGTPELCADCWNGTSYSGTYTYKTAEGSSIAVTVVQGSFYELDYGIGPAPSSVLGHRFSVLNASVTAASIMTSLGVPMENISVMDQRFSLSPSVFELEWSQSMEGLPIAEALLAKGGSGQMRNVSASFRFNPGLSQLTGITITGADWYEIPSGFPLLVTAPDAVNLAADYATNLLGVTNIASARVAFAAVQNHLYYSVTLASGNSRYLLFVNPRTGEVGLPS